MKTFLFAFIFIFVTNAGYARGLYTKAPNPEASDTRAMVVYPEFEFLKSRNGNIVATYPLPPAKLDLPKFRDIPDTSKNFGTFFAYEPNIAKNFPKLHMCLKEAAANKRQVVLKGTWKPRYIEDDLDEYLPDYSTIFCKQIASSKDCADAVIGERTIVGRFIHVNFGYDDGDECQLQFRLLDGSFVEMYAPPNTGKKFDELPPKTFVQVTYKIAQKWEEESFEPGFGNMPPMCVTVNHFVTGKVLQKATYN